MADNHTVEEEIDFSSRNRQFGAARFSNYNAIKGL